MTKKIWEEEKFQKSFREIATNPKAAAEAAALNAAMKEAGITPAQVWAKIEKLRAMGETGEDIEDLEEENEDEAPQSLV